MKPFTKQAGVAGLAEIQNRLDGMADFLAVPAAHSLIMRDPAVMQQVLNFLSHGRFEHQGAG